MSGEKVNFLLGAAPNWADDATLSAGGEVAERPVQNVQNRTMENVWRTPSLKPHHTQLEVDHGPSPQPSRCLLLGNLNLPESTTLLRVRKGPDVTDEWIRPKARTAGSGVALLAPTNASGDIEDLNEGIDSPTTWVTPTDPNLSMDFRVPLRNPTQALIAGDWNHAVQVAYSDHNLAAAPGASIEVQLWQDGQDTGLSYSESAFPDGETGVWVAELKFDSADLPDPSGSDLEVRVVTTPGGDGLAIRVGAVRCLATIAQAVEVPAVAQQFLAVTNADAETAEGLSASDIYAQETSVGVGPDQDSLSLDFRVGFDDPGPFAAGATHRLSIRYRATSGTNGSFDATVYVNGSATSVTDSATAAGGTEDQWLDLEFPDTEIGDGSDVELRIVTTPSGSENVEIVQVQWFVVAAADRYDFDTGWVRAWPPNPGSLWGIDLPEQVGKQVMKSRPVVYFDDAKNVLTLSTRYTRVELLVAANGPYSFVDSLGNTATTMDMGRVAEGPAMSGIQLATGFEVDTVDMSTRELSAGGVPWEDDEASYRLIRLEFTNLEAMLAVSDIFDYVLRRIGTSGDLLLVILPEDDIFLTRMFVWGPLERTPRLRHAFGSSFRASLELRERL